MNLNENGQDAHSQTGSKAPSLAALGKLIAQKRAEKSLTLEQLAELVGVEPAVVEALESGNWEIAPELSNEVAQILRLKLTGEFL